MFQAAAKRFFGVIDVLKQQSREMFFDIKPLLLLGPQLLSDLYPWSSIRQNQPAEYFMYTDDVSVFLRKAEAAHTDFRTKSRLVALLDFSFLFGLTNDREFDLLVSTQSQRTRLSGMRYSATIIRYRKCSSVPMTI